MRPRASWITTAVVTLLFQVAFVLNGSSHRLRDLGAPFTVLRGTFQEANDTVFSNSNKILSQKLDNYNDTLSICLLTKDDVHILPEWLAYHYHVANLRTLVVMVDPTSKTYPTDMFHRFRALLPDLEILEWKDCDIMPENRLDANGTLDADKVADYRKEYLRPIKSKWLRDQVVNKYLPKNVTEQEIQRTMKLVGVHRYRQEYMATQCANHLRESGRAWVSLLDSDEYIRIGSTMDIDGGVATPNMYEPGSIMKWINTVHSHDTECIKMPWYRHGSIKEISEEALLNSSVPEFDPKQFMTLRWRFHNEAENNGKDCLNVARADGRHFPLDKITNVHKLASICGTSYTRTTKSNPVAISHYTGTWEQYSKRDDVRRIHARSDFESKASAVAIPDDGNIASWFRGFISIHGVEKTKQLLGESYLS